MVFRGRKFGNFPFRKQKEILPRDELTELSEILKKDYLCFIRTYLCIPINGAGLQNVLNTCSRGFNKNVFSTVSWVNDKNVMELPNSMNDQFMQGCSIDNWMNTIATQNSNARFVPKFFTCWTTFFLQVTMNYMNLFCLLLGYCR